MQCKSLWIKAPVKCMQKSSKAFHQNQCSFWTDIVGSRKKLHHY